MKVLALLFLIGSFAILMALATDEGKSADDLDIPYKDMYDEEDNK